MEITFNTIKPFVRFVRHHTLLPKSNTQTTFPYDARLFYVEEGENIIKVNGVRYQMKTGSVIIINSGVEYYLETPKAPVTYIAINFDFTFANSNNIIPIIPATSYNYDSTKLIENIVFSDATAFNKVLFIEHMPAIEQRLISMEKEFTTKLSFYELRLSSAMTDILVKCFRQTTLHHSLTDGTEISNKIVTYIVKNYNKNLNNKDIAREFNYHPNYVSNLIKTYTGQPLHQYIKNIRVSEASNMLLNTNKSIMDISDACGFFDSSHFIRCFKSIAGVTPQQYRDYYL